MKRREFIAGLGGAVVAWPLVTQAQQGERMRRIGVLMLGDENDPVTKNSLSAFTQALAGLGWTDGRNVLIDLRSANADTNRMRAFAQELVGLQSDIILTATTPAAVALQRETQTIPIVFVSVSDPVASGLVPRLDRPSGNITGFAVFEPSLGGKWLELLSGIAPNPDGLTRSVLALIEAIGAAAARYGVKAIRIAVRSTAEIEPAIDMFAAGLDGGIIVVPTVGTLPDAVQVINQLALQHRLPTFYFARTAGVAEEGGLMSYGADATDLFRRGRPDYVDRILGGAKPSELPVQFSTKFEMVINMKTAKAIGLTVPESFLLRADEVIE